MNESPDNIGVIERPDVQREIPDSIAKMWNLFFSDVEVNRTILGILIPDEMGGDVVETTKENLERVREASVDFKVEAGSDEEAALEEYWEYEENKLDLSGEVTPIEVTEEGGVKKVTGEKKKVYKQKEQELLSGEKTLADLKPSEIVGIISSYALFGNLQTANTYRKQAAEYFESIGEILFAADLYGDMGNFKKAQELLFTFVNQTSPDSKLNCEKLTAAYYMIINAQKNLMN